MESPADPSAAALAHRLQAERTRSAFSRSRWGQPTGALAGVVLALAIAFGDGMTTGLALWIAAQFAILVWEAFVCRAWMRTPAEAQGDARWERALTLGCVLFGLLWAVMTVFLMPAHPVLQMVVLTTIVATVTATLGVIGASALPYFAYVVPTMAGMMVCFLMRGGYEYMTLAVLDVLYTGFLVAMQRLAKAQFDERLHANLRNEALVAQLQRTDAALKQSLAEHELLFDLASVGIAEFRDNLVVRANARLEQMLGYEPDALIGQPSSVLHRVHADPAEIARIEETLARGLTYEQDVRVRCRDGNSLWVALACRAVDPQRPLAGVIAVFHDITDRRERESAMQRLAHEDALTGLPNRRLLDDRLQQALHRASRHGGRVALLLIDLDGFKKINDEHGHAVGDEVLAAVAQRLQAAVRASDTVSRLGGDEFVVLLDQPVAAGAASQVAQKLVAAVGEAIPVGAWRLHVGASIGIAIGPRDGQDGETLMRHADAAMYRAKQAGRGTWRAHGDAIDEGMPATATSWGHSLH